MRRLAIVALGVAAACWAQAQTYKWIDEQGRVQYTQTPPPPGRQAQPIKPPATQAPPRPDAGAQPSGASQKPAGKGKDDVITADARQMMGEWRTHPGARVQVRFQLQQDGATLRTGQTWTVGEDTHVSSGMKVVVSGAKSAGMLMQDTSDKLPSTLGYELRGDGLILTVASGPYAGTHLLTRNR